MSTALPAWPAEGLLLEATGLSLPVAGSEARVEGLDLRLSAGQAVQLHGPVDAGSAVLRAIMGLTRPEAGTIRLLGQDPAGLARRAEVHLTRVGWLPRTGALLSNLTLRENLLLPFEFHLGRSDEGRAAAALHRFGLEAALDVRPERVPLRVRRCVALARAVLLDPVLLVLDDPLDDLDEDGAQAVTAALSRWASEPGHALLVASPDHLLASALGARRLPLPVT
jgi:ABC-type multidrug transport system ATPase subunit